MNSYFEDMLPANELAQLKYIPTIPEFVTWIENKWGNLPALSDTVNTFTYAQMCEAIARKRAMLNAMGLVKGDKVAILDNTTVEAVEMFLAVTSAGYTAINLPSQLPAPALAGCCQKFGVKVLAAGAAFMETAQSAACTVMDIADTGTVGELRKAHYQELIPAVELDRMPVAAVTVDTLLELVFVDERHDLREDGFPLVHDLRTAA